MSLVEIRQIGRVAVIPTVEKVTVKDRSQSVATVVVISNNRWTDAQGKAQERATSVSWTVWGKVADNAAQYLTVGSRVSVSGTLESRRYQDKGGKDVFTYEFTARSMDFLDTKAEVEARRSDRKPENSTATSTSKTKPAADATPTKAG